MVEVEGLPHGLPGKGRGGWRRRIRRLFADAGGQNLGNGAGHAWGRGGRSRVGPRAVPDEEERETAREDVAPAQLVGGLRGAQPAWKRERWFCHGAPDLGSGSDERTAGL